MDIIEISVIVMSRLKNMRYGLVLKVASISVVLTLVTWVGHARSQTAAPRRTSEQDRQALIDVENYWVEE
jgi:hypothetical protein